MRIREGGVLALLALVAVTPAMARAQASVTTVEHGPWASSVTALQSDTSSQGTALSVCVRDEGASRCAPCGSYTLAFDDAGQHAFEIGACDAASGTTGVSLIDRSALFEEGRVVPQPRTITIEASLVRSVASSGGAATTGGSTLDCTARLHPFLRDLEHGGVVTLGPDRFRVVTRDASVTVVALGDGWMLESETHIASDVAYDIVEIAGGEPVMSGHVSLECASETTTRAVSEPAVASVPVASDASDYGQTHSCSAVTTTDEGVLTNVPAITYIHRGMRHVVLVSSTFIARPGALSWVGEIRNVGHEVVCPFVQLGIGQAPWVDVAFEAPPHALRGVDGTFPCIGPGETGVAHQTFLDETLADVVRAGEVYYAMHRAEGIVPMLHAAVVHARVTRTVHDTTDGVDAYEARGRVRGISAPVDSVEIDVFPRDPCGLLGNALSAFPTVPTSREVTFTTLGAASFDFRRSLVFSTYTPAPPS